MGYFEAGRCHCARSGLVRTMFNREGIAHLQQSFVEGKVMIEPVHADLRTWTVHAHRIRRRGTTRLHGRHGIETGHGIIRPGRQRRMR